MISFKNLDDFVKFYESLEIYNKWKIMTGSLNNRGSILKDRHYVIRLKKLFAEKQLFRRNVSVAEIVSWLDSYLIIERLINRLKCQLDTNIYNNIKLMSEYKIELSKNRRVDYIFEYQDRLLICEFRLSDKFPNMSNMWQKKELELLIYKELMNNYLSEKYDIIVYAFVGMPEYDNKNIIEKHVIYNRNNIMHFAEYIIKYLIKE